MGPGAWVLLAQPLAGGGAEGMVGVAVSDGIADGGDPGREEAVRSALGYLPAQRITVAAGCNGRADHYGTVHEIYYDLSEHQIWVCHIVDVAFLRAWLLHPHFHMIIK